MHPFWDLGPRKNPAWSNAAVTRRWNAIERLVGRAHMPLRSGAKLKEYGTGRYGVALPTATKGVVLKVTTDESEALVAAWLAAHPEDVAAYEAWAGDGWRVFLAATAAPHDG